MPRTRMYPALALLALLTCAVSAQAQVVDDPSPELVQMQMERTDLRIEQAETLVMATDNEQAAMQLAAAVSLQGRARESFAAQNYAFALRLTIESRGHADRAIAIVKNLPDPERVRLQLERTQEMLERARERSEECNNDRARAMLKAAFDMQSRAIEAARNGHYLVALQLTVSARGRALRALRLCNLEDNLQEGAERQLQHTDNVISRATEIVEGCKDEQAPAALGNAMELQDRAKSEFAAEHYRPALKLTQAARRAAYRAIQFCSR